jgi:hypothetical protein
VNTSKSKTFIIALLVLAVVGIGTFAWRQMDELNALRSSKVSEKDMAALRQRAFDAEKRIKELEAELALAKANPPAADTATARGNRGAANGNATAANGQGGPQQGGPGGRGNQLQAILNNPQAIALQATAEKANLSVQYAGFFRNSGLTGEQADAVTTLLANRQNVMQDLMAAAQASGMQADPQSLQSLVADQQAQIDAQLKATMGDAAYAQYQAYQSTLTRRQEVASYQQQLTMAGVPLDAAQTEALIAALGPSTGGGGGGRGGAGGAGGFGGIAGIGGGGRGGGVSNISANNLTAAASVLNSTQLQVLQATQQAQQASNSLNQITGGGRGAPQQQRGGQAAGGAGGGAVTGGTTGAATATRAARGN